jgi:hypothetical protein
MKKPVISQDGQSFGINIKVDVFEYAVITQQLRASGYIAMDEFPSKAQVKQWIRIEHDNAIYTSDTNYGSAEDIHPTKYYV